MYLAFDIGHRYKCAIVDLFHYGKKYLSFIPQKVNPTFRRIEPLN